MRNKQKTEPNEKPKIELTDVTMIGGLGLLFAGLGFAVSWPVACAVTGGVIIILTVWLLTPRPKGS